MFAASVQRNAARNEETLSLGTIYCIAVRGPRPKTRTIMVYRMKQNRALQETKNIKSKNHILHRGQRTIMDDHGLQNETEYSTARNVETLSLKPYIASWPEDDYGRSWSTE